MRSKRISTLAEVAVAALLLLTVDARAETIARVRVNTEDLPKIAQPWTIDPKYAVLPSGARHGGKVPASWARGSEYGDDELSRCVDGRRGELGLIRNDQTFTARIFESGGKEYMDRASVETKDGAIRVTEATRVPLARVADGLWAYRTNEHVSLVAAVDEGALDHAVFYRCAITEHVIRLSAGSGRFESSASRADEAMRAIKGDARRALPRWTGAEMRVTASVSRSSADPAPTLSLVIRRDPAPQ